MHFDEEIQRIEKLVASDDSRDWVYAALECRLVLERIAYWRFEVSSAKTNKKLYDWRPKQILDALEKEVGDTVFKGLTLSIAQGAPEKSPATASDYEELDWIKLGTQANLNVKMLNRYWQSMSSFLHFSEEERPIELAEKIRRRVNAAVGFIREFNKGNLAMGPIGSSISFDCTCGTKISRQEDTLQEKQLVACNNPDCNESYLAFKESGEWVFERRTTQGTCNYCGHLMIIPALFFDKMRGNQHLYFDCEGCGEKTAGVFNRSLKQKAKED